MYKRSLVELLGLLWMAVLLNIRGKNSRPSGIYHHGEPCEQQAASYHLISVYSSLLRPGVLRVPLLRRVSRGPGILVGK
jgi:hypothetical protein